MYVTSNSSHVYILVAILIAMRMQEFLPRDAMRISAVFVVVRCPSVCHVGSLYPHG